jgi:glycerol-3-phosphate acyltransferase PlsY
LLRVSSLSALIAVALSPLFAFALDRPTPTVVLATVLAVLVFVRHRDNIRRLRNGSEPKIGGAKTEGA